MEKYEKSKKKEFDRTWQVMNTKREWKCCVESPCGIRQRYRGMLAGMLRVIGVGRSDHLNTRHRNHGRLGRLVPTCFAPSQVSPSFAHLSTISSLRPQSSRFSPLYPCSDAHTSTTREYLRILASLTPTFPSGPTVLIKLCYNHYFTPYFLLLLFFY